MKQARSRPYYEMWMGTSDGDLVESALEGDETAFQTLVERYQNLVFNIVYHYLGRPQDVEDISQDVFLKLYRALSRYDRKRPFKAWVSRITVNACFDELRRRRKQKEQLFSEIGDKEGVTESFFDRFMTDQPVTEFEAERVLSWLHALMEDLPEKDRMAFVLREIEGLDYGDIAESLETSEVAVRIRVSRSRKKLLESLRGKMATV